MALYAKNGVYDERPFEYIKKTDVWFLDTTFNKVHNMTDLIAVVPNER